jgi:hypothetical protein
MLLAVALNAITNMLGRVVRLPHGQGHGGRPGPAGRR